MSPNCVTPLPEMCSFSHSCYKYKHSLTTRSVHGSAFFMFRHSTCCRFCYDFVHFKVDTHHEQVRRYWRQQQIHLVHNNKMYGISTLIYRHCRIWADCILFRFCIVLTNLISIMFSSSLLLLYLCVVVVPLAPDHTWRIEWSMFIENWRFRHFRVDGFWCVFYANANRNLRR